MPAPRHPKTKQLLLELQKWSEQEYGRKSELARLLDVSPATIGDWFAGRRTPSLDHGFRIEELLKGKSKRKAKKPKKLK